MNGWTEVGQLLLDSAKMGRESSKERKDKEIP